MQTYRHILWAFIKQFLFWLLLFNIGRILFLIWYAHMLKGVDALSITAVSWHALRLDISSCSYLLAFTFIILLVQSVWSPRWLNILHAIYTTLITLIFFLVTLAELGVYEEWRTKLHYKALLYLLHPEEIVRTGETWILIMLFFMLLILSVTSWLFWKKFIFIKLYKVRVNWLFTISFLFITPVLFVLGIRGGWQQIPINQSDAYYSKKDILNITAVNSLWNLTASVYHNYGLLDNNPFEYYAQHEAEQTVKELYTKECDSTKVVFKTDRPNIVFFILEGFSADLIESQGGEVGITPFFHELEKQGILFRDVYSSGTRSQQGMAAIFSGFPSHPLTTITQQSEKYRKLPSLVMKLEEQGYSSSFFFGGQLTYGNIKSYIIDMGFDVVEDEAEIDSDVPRGKLGVHDEYTFPLFLRQIDKNKQPFIASIFTLSSHSPYDMNIEMPLQWPEFEKEFVNSALYTDNCLKQFFNEAAMKSWFSNTVFILIGDHGHSTYRNWDFYSPEYHKIAFLMCGPAIRDEFRGLQIDKTGCQTDLPATLLAQMKISADDFRWSKNLLDSCTQDFGCFSFEEGIGWVRPGGICVYDNRIDKYYYLHSDSASGIGIQQLEREAKSYLQCVFREYLDK